MPPIIGFAITVTAGGHIACRPVWVRVWLEATLASLHDAMALIGFVFHWQPDWCLGQRYSDLMGWRDRAAELHKAANSSGEDEH